MNVVIRLFFQWTPVGFPLPLAFIPCLAAWFRRKNRRICTGSYAKVNHPTVWLYCWSVSTHPGMASYGVRACRVNASRCHHSNRCRPMEQPRWLASGSAALLPVPPRRSIVAPPWIQTPDVQELHSTPSPHPIIGLLMLWTPVRVWLTVAFSLRHRLTQPFRPAAASL